MAASGQAAQLAAPQAVGSLETEYALTPDSGRDIAVQSSRCSFRRLVFGVVVGVAVAVVGIAVIVTVAVMNGDAGQAGQVIRHLQKCDLPPAFMPPSSVMQLQGNMGRLVGWFDDLFMSPALRRQLAEEDEVWGVMKSWAPRRTQPGPPTPPRMDIGMYMWGNEMKMVNTRFSAVSTNLEVAVNASVDRKLQAEDPCVNMLDLQGKRPGAYRLSDVKYKSWSAGPVLSTKYMLQDTMSMTDTTFIAGGQEKSEPRLEIASSSFTSVAITQKRGQAETSLNHLYMMNNELSMHTTIFTMNVNSNALSVSAGAVGDMPHRNGAGDGDGVGDERYLANMFDVNTLNINMYMCHNDMSMATTNFKWNVDPSMQPEPSTASQSEQLTNGDDKNVELVMLLPLLVAAFGSDSAETRLRGTGRALASPNDVWAWVKELGAGGGTVDINMHMYNNTMSMTDTIFTMNVGTTTGSASMPMTQPQATANSKRQSLGASAGSDLSILKEAMQMTDTIFTMNVGASASSRHLKAAAGQRNMNIGSLNVRMFMYSNKMSMTDTVFTSNMG